MSKKKKGPLKIFAKAILPLYVQNFLKKAIERPSPIEKILKELERREVKLKELNALELFGRDGNWHTISYAPLVKSLEIWEIQEKYREALHKNLPHAKVKITDSFQEIKSTTEKYNFIVVDNSMGLFWDDLPGGNPTVYCEHFELFPDIFRVVEDSAILIINVIPRMNRAAKKRYPDIFNENQLKRRASFYGTVHPENFALSDMKEFYSNMVKQGGFRLDWSFSQRRGGTKIVYYLILKISR